MDKNTNKELNAVEELAELIGVVWKQKWIVIIVTVMFAVGSIFYALSLPNKFTSSALVQINEAESSNILNALGGQLGGLASLAGVDINSKNNFSNIVMETIQSRTFIAKFVEQENIKQYLFAAQTWDPVTNAMTFNPSVYDTQSDTWVREIDERSLKKPEPSLLESYEQFMEIFSVDQDAMTGLVTIKVEFINPHLAQQWTQGLIELLNAELRAKEIREKTAYIEYLTKKIENINNVEIKAIFFELIEEELKRKLLAEVEEEFALKVIDPAVSPEMKSSPRRALIVVLATMFGGLLSVIGVLALHYFRVFRRI
ncbi:Wzz/FepE/Etk N-terminal domain-containing protein [Aestuariibacter sp. AA17]|uniref:Wzz/FepE/Etk N-terminal domain-containing protein n=1 Tax=Fluctibacter corallii TaxID=2984329 RepID=A0ABT3A3M1_9ALTE|nr:Wzz/FepE/Etk N-terminal domain-containing protein [Aestuariibacter sp. AA17]MCV2883278.1 Wzz/FepE/Etk N-terminal domain-containing protein [Aestuariibacter sp. AA17]